MSEGISIREFARREKVSDAAVRKAISLGKLTAYADKSINPALVGTAWRKSAAESANQEREPRANQVRSETKVRTGSHPEVRTGSHQASPSTAPQDTIELSSLVNDGETLEDAANRLAGSGQVPSHTYAEALRRKENYLALLHQLKYEREAGLLVDLPTAERALFEGARAMRDAWLGWPSKVGPLLAADLGLEADRVTGALTEHVHRHIAQLGEPDVHFDAK